MATYWENSCSFGLRYVSWYKYLIVSLVFSHLGFWSGNLFLIAPFPDLCLLVPSQYQQNTDDKVNLGGKTAYSLVGACFHGKSGLKQSIKADMWRKYVFLQLGLRF